MTENLPVPVQMAAVKPKKSTALVPSSQVRPTETIVAIMGGANRSGGWTAPQQLRIIAIMGGGLLGLLVGYLCACLPESEVTVIDALRARAELARALGAHFATPDAAPTDCDLVFHVSATADGLATALRLAGEEASVVELSWYGSAEVAAPLGQAFHSRRLRLLSSQVGKVAASHRSRWTHRRRLAAALALLKDPRLDVLLSPPVAFEDLPAKLPALLSSESNAVCPTIRYNAASAMC